MGTTKLPRVHQLRIAILFALFEALMPVIGIFVGSLLAASIGHYAKFIGAIVLLCTGVYTFFKTADGDVEDAGATPSASKTWLLAVVLSLDNLSVGFGLGMFHVSLALAAVVFGGISLLLTFLGLEVGRMLGHRLSISTDRLTGIILAIVAVFMVV